MKRTSIQLPEEQPMESSGRETASKRGKKRATIDPKTRDGIQSTKKEEEATDIDSILLEVEACRNRFRKSLAITRQKLPKKEVKKIRLEHEIYDQEVADGVFTPTSEQVDALNLVPHFDPLKQISFRKIKQTENVKRKPPPGISEEEYEQMFEIARKKCEEDYDEKYKVFAQQFAAPEGDHTTSHFITRQPTSSSMLQRAVGQLQHQIEIIKNQTETLNRHISLLEKAKSKIEIEIDSIESTAIPWKKEQIEKYYAEHPECDRRLRQPGLKRQSSIYMSSSKLTKAFSFSAVPDALKLI